VMADEQETRAAPIPDVGPEDVDQDAGQETRAAAVPTDAASEPPPPPPPPPPVEPARDTAPSPVPGPAEEEAPPYRETPRAAHEASPGRATWGVDAATDAYADRPELYVAAAFAGGLVLAQILKRLGSDE
jgi:hypothetical protein